MRTAIVLGLERAAPSLAALRAELDPENAARLPLHLTLLYPFAEAADLDGDALAGLRSFFGGQRMPRFSLSRVELLAPEWVYAAPEPAEPLEALMEELWARYPEFPPYAGEIAHPVPHATLTRVAPAGAEAAALGIGRRAAPLLPAECAVAAATLLEEVPAGPWRALEHLPFGAAA